jgi:hypothetical protein
MTLRIKVVLMQSIMHIAFHSLERRGRQRRGLGLNQYGAPLRGRAFIDRAVLCQKDTCLIWPFARNGSNGYAMYAGTTVARLMCEKINGPCPPGHETAYFCGNGRAGCINPRHVAWKTPNSIQMDRVLHGTSNRGERNGTNKLTEAQARAIRAAKGTCPRGLSYFPVLPRRMRCSNFIC